MFYSFFFMGALAAEIAVIVLFFILGLSMETSFLFLTGMTAVAMALFLTEAIRLHRKVQPKNSEEG
jgi:uncharacterized membrane protein